ncbi:MAG: SRPBCC domain-containing protein [Alphaproteobacteria bacterium]|nr:SRPBCC domain-containing protein [Alphaproteobacteria bacterium]
MPLDRFTVARVIAASPAQIYAAWLSSEQHAGFTGAEASLEPEVGGAIRCWGGFITGHILSLEPDRRMVFAWRTQAFPDGAGPSRVEVTLEPAEGGTRVRVDHSEIPTGQGKDYFAGWQERYFDKLDAWFAR